MDLGGDKLRPETPGLMMQWLGRVILAVGGDEQGIGFIDIVF
jgi:hypothetical protein